MQAVPPSGPTILGFDIIWIATMLSAVATFAVMLAIYAATTVKDPMARRVKALNERREQLKAGIVASTNKRKQLTNRNQAADQRPATPVAVQDASGRSGQEGAAEADAGRYPDQGPRLLHHLRALRPAGRARHYGCRADLRHQLFPDLVVDPPIHDRRGRAGRQLQGAGHLAQEQGHQAQPRDPQGSSRRARPARHLRRSRSHGRRRFRPRLEGVGQGISGTRRRVRPDCDRARVPQRAPSGVREPRKPRRPRGGARRRHDHDPDREIRYAARFSPSRALGRVPSPAHDARGRKGGPSAGNHDRAAHPFHSPDVVRRHPWPCGLLDQRQLHTANPRRGTRRHAEA